MTSLNPRVPARRPAVPLALASLAGAALGGLLPVAAWIGLLLPALSSLGLALWRAGADRPERRASGLLVGLMLAVAGCLVGLASALERRALPARPQASAPWAGPCRLEGTVVSELAWGPGSRRSWLVASGAHRVWLEGTAENEGALRPGARLSALGRFAPPAAALDPGGWDPWSRMARLGASWRFVATRVVEREAGRGLGALRASCHAALRARLEASLRGARRAIAGAALLGVRAPLPPEDAAAFDAAGATHVLSISGLHVSLVAALALVALRAVGLGSRAQRLAAGALVLAFLALVGLAAPIVRATAAGVIALLGPARGDGWNRLATGLAVVLALDPLAPADLGCLLSFGTVAAMALIAAPLGERRAGWLAGCAIPFAASAALVAVLLGVVPLAALPTGPAVVALSGVLLAAGLSGLALGIVAPAAGAPLLALTDQVAGLLLEVVRWGALALPPARIVPPAALTPWLAVGLLALAAVRAERRAPRWRALLACGLLVAAAAALPRLPGAPASLGWRAPAPGEQRVLLRRRGRALLVGAGGATAAVGDPPVRWSRWLAAAAHATGAPRVHWPDAPAPRPRGVRLIRIGGDALVASAPGWRALLVRAPTALVRAAPRLPPAALAVDVLAAGPRAPVHLERLRAIARPRRSLTGPAADEASSAPAGR